MCVCVCASIQRLSLVGLVSGLRLGLALRLLLELELGVASHLGVRVRAVGA